MEKTSKAAAGGLVKKGIVGAVILALAVGAFFAVNYVMQLQEYKKRIADISISNVDLSKIPDGSYTGSYDAIMIAAKVRVDISNHVIQDIDSVSQKRKRKKSRKHCERSQIGAVIESGHRNGRNKQQQSDLESGAKCVEFRCEGVMALVGGGLPF